MDINGLNSSSSQYQNSMQDTPEVGGEGNDPSPQLQSNPSPFGGAGNEASAENIGQMTQVLQSLLRVISGALSTMQSMQSSQSSSQGAPSGEPGDASQSPQTSPDSPRVSGPEEEHQSPKMPPSQSPGTERPMPQARSEHAQGSGQEGGAGGGGQDQGGMIKFAQILQGLLGTLLSVIPFIGSSLSALTTRIGSSAQNH